MKSLLTTFTAIILFIGVVAAQDTNTHGHNVTISVPQVAIMDIEGPGGETSITLAATAPTEAGNGLDFSATNSSLWLNFTSVVSGGKSRKIQANVSGTLPGGVSLLVQAGAISSTGKGNRGKAVANAITLGTTDQDIVTDIKSGYTGNGVNNGYPLTYSLAMDENAYENLLHGSQTVTVTYTITAEN